MSDSVTQHILAEGRKPVSSLSDFILYNVASSFFHQALILKRGHHTLAQPGNSWTVGHIAYLSSEKKRKIIYGYGEKGEKLLIKIKISPRNKSVERGRIVNTYFLPFVVASFCCAPSPVKAVSVLMEGNLRVISCLCLWMIRCSSNWKRCSTPTEWERHEEMRAAAWRDTWDEMFMLNQLMPLVAD